MLKNSVTASTATEFFIYGIITMYAPIPCRDHRFIHGVYIGIWSLAHLYNISMAEVRIGSIIDHSRSTSHHLTTIARAESICNKVSIILNDLHYPEECLCFPLQSPTPSLLNMLKVTFYVCPYDNLVYIIYLQGKRSSVCTTKSFIISCSVRN